MKFLDQLRAQDPSSEAAYHLEGLMDASAKIVSLMEQLGSTEDSPDGNAEKLTYLQVEIYGHLFYHMKELRRPLKALITRAYEGVADDTPVQDRDR